MMEAIIPLLAQDGKQAGSIESIPCVRGERKRLEMMDESKFFTILINIRYTVGDFKHLNR
jgi:hypothetical protein